MPGYLKPHRIYIAGASAEMDRARRAADLVKQAGLELVSTWLDVVAKVGDANPPDATSQDRLTWSYQDLAQVDAADLVWFLVPPYSQPTRGGWLEVGFAQAKRKLLVFSGDTKQSIFCAIGREYEDDLVAFANICQMARDGAWAS